MKRERKRNREWKLLVTISGDEASPKGLRVYRVESIELIFEINHNSDPQALVRNIVLSVRRIITLNSTYVPYEVPRYRSHQPLTYNNKALLTLPNKQAFGLWELPKCL